MSRTGTRAPNGSGTTRSDGYRQVKLIGHPLADPHGVVFEHRAILYDKVGPIGADCHYCKKFTSWEDGLEGDHSDRNRQNNVDENIVPCCPACNRGRWNREKTGCPYNHGEYDKQYRNGHRYCSKCKAEKEKRRRLKRKSMLYAQTLLYIEEV